LKDPSGTVGTKAARGLCYANVEDTN